MTLSHPDVSIHPCRRHIQMIHSIIDAELSQKYDVLRLQKHAELGIQKHAEFRIQKHAEL